MVLETVSYSWLGAPWLVDGRERQRPGLLRWRAYDGMMKCSVSLHGSRLGQVISALNSQIPPGPKNCRAWVYSWSTTMLGGKTQVAWS